MNARIDCSACRTRKAASAQRTAGARQPAELARQRCSVAVIRSFTTVATEPLDPDADEAHATATRARRRAVATARAVLIEPARAGRVGSRSASERRSYMPRGVRHIIYSLEGEGRVPAALLHAPSQRAQPSPPPSLGRPPPPALHHAMWPSAQRRRSPSRTRAVGHNAISNRRSTEVRKDAVIDEWI